MAASSRKAEQLIWEQMSPIDGYQKLKEVNTFLIRESRLNNMLSVDFKRNDGSTQSIRYALLPGAKEEDPVQWHDVPINEQEQKEFLEGLKDIMIPINSKTSEEALISLKASIELHLSDEIRLKPGKSTLFDNRVNPPIEHESKNERYRSMSQFVDSILHKETKEESKLTASSSSSLPYKTFSGEGKLERKTEEPDDDIIAPPGGPPVHRKKGGR